MVLYLLVEIYQKVRCGSTEIEEGTDNLGRYVMSALQELVEKFVKEAQHLIDLQSVKLPATPNPEPLTPPVREEGTEQVANLVPNVPLPIPDTPEWAVGAFVKRKGMGDWDKLTIIGKYESMLLTKNEVNGMTYNFDWTSFEPWRGANG